MSPLSEETKNYVWSHNDGLDRSTGYGGMTESNMIRFLQFVVVSPSWPKETQDASFLNQFKG